MWGALTSIFVQNNPKGTGQKGTKGDKKGHKGTKNSSEVLRLDITIGYNNFYVEQQVFHMLSIL